MEPILSAGLKSGAKEGEQSMNANTIEQHFGAIRIESLDAMRVACYRAASPTPEEDGSRYIDEWVARQPVNGPVRRFGFDVDVTPEEHQAGWRGYEVWRNVGAQVQPGEGVTIKDFAGGLYAVMTLDKPFGDPFSIIPAGWKYLHEWVIASSKYQSGSHQWMEELLARKDGEDLKLYHPVAPASAQAEGD
jgi:hypothetical protein